MKDKLSRYFVFCSLWPVLGLAFAFRFPPSQGIPEVSLSAGRIRILSPEDLHRELDSVSILDCRPRQDVRVARIPGSQHVDWKNWARARADALNLWFGKKPEWGLVRDPDAKLRNQLRKLGLSNSRTIVVVGHPGGWGEEGRVAWNLLYWGADDVALLDGGFPAWSSKSEYPLERGNIKVPEEGDFTFHLRPQRRARLEQIKEAAGESRVIIDSRSKQEFDGKRHPGQKRGGHVPGAISFPVEKLYQADGRYANKEALATMTWDKKKGIPIAYCVGGIRSALLAMVWEARFGEMISNYDGSMWEWSAHPDLPLRTQPPR